MKNTSQVWVGLFEVRPLAGNDDILNGALGAFVNVVGISSGHHCFVSRAENLLTESGFHVVASKDIGLFSERAEKGDVIDELTLLAADLSDECPIIFDEFQAFDFEHEH